MNSPIKRTIEFYIAYGRPYLEQIIAYRLPPGEMVAQLRAITNKEQRIGFYFYDPRHKSTTLHKNHISN